MKTFLIAFAAIATTTVAVAQMFPCAIAISHCWTGREVTQTINQLFRESR